MIMMDMIMIMGTGELGKFQTKIGGASYT